MGLVHVSFRFCLNPDRVGDILGGSVASGGVPCGDTNPGSAP